MKLPREAYIPSGSRIAQYDVGDKQPAIVARYERRDRPCAIMFAGRRSKPDHNYRYQSDERREDHINQWLSALREASAYKAERRPSGAHSLEVGNILYTSWGYDQTNVDFYQVVEVPSKCFVILQPIYGAPAMGSEQGGPSERVMAAKDSFKGEPIRRKADKHGNVRIDSVRHASPWDGRALHKTGSGWGH